MDDAARRERFAEFVHANFSSLMTIAVAVSGSRVEAEDLVQTALTNAYPRWQRIRPDQALAYLRRFPVHALKIDRSFVDAIGTDDNSARIITAIVALARSLQLKIVAEGVEQPEQAAFLKAQGCEAAQGFYYAKPVPAEVLADMLRRQAFESGEPATAL